MKILGVVMLFLLAFSNAKGQGELEVDHKYYVVIGAFSLKSNAERYVSHATSSGLQAVYKMNTNRNLYYVFSMTTEQRQEAYDEVLRVRADYNDFTDAWVFNNGALPPSEETNVMAVAEHSSTETVAPEALEDTSGRKVLKDNEIQEFVYDHASADTAATAVASAQVPREDGVYEVYLNAINVGNYKEVKGKVKVVDPIRTKEIGQLKTHKLEEVHDPNNRANKVTFITDIFGFREVQHTIVLDKPINDTTKAFTHVEGDSIILDFEMKRFKKGDVLVMYNVYFYKDAAIMRPESVYELNSLLDMLQENENYRVALHGHTNGGAAGKIIRVNEDNKNYFSLSSDNIEGVGSAKKLSFYRAEIIQDWLIEQGIDKSRMEVKGWGGKKMLFDKFDSQAYKNVRVEVEITDD